MSQSVNKSTDAPATDNAVADDVRAATRAAKKSEAALEQFSVEDVDPRDVATFRLLPPRRPGYRITLKSSEMAFIKTADGSMKSMAAPATAVHVVWRDVVHHEADPWRIAELIKAPVFGRDYGVDTNDPTGYWQKRGVVKKLPRTVSETRVMENIDDIRTAAIGSP